MASNLWSPHEDITMLSALAQGVQQNQCPSLLQARCSQQRSTTSAQSRCQFLRKKHPQIWNSESKSWNQEQIYH